MEFAIKIYDVPDSGSLRDEYRDRHLAYLKKFDETTRFSGPFLTDDGAKELGSFRINEFPDRAAAERHVAEEPFVLGGVQKKEAVIHRWQTRAPFSYRDCPREKGNIQFLIYALDKPDGLAMRDEVRKVHQEYLGNAASIIMARGSLVSDDGSHQFGSLLMIDVPDLAAAKAFWENEPYNKGGLFETVEFYRWRFGRISDRFKG
ncbi:MAG: YciI family protein [Rhodospirillales bacterium]|nr:YciI family protein [Rhodospirillales bacterium]